MLDGIKLLEMYGQKFPEERLDPPKAANIRHLVGLLHLDKSITDQRWRSYMLATVHRETGAQFMPVIEKGKASYFERYEGRTEVGKQLGNVKSGDGYLFRGRGYVQITGRGNYQRFGTFLRIPLEEQPSLALNENTAYDIMSLGMVRGLFTGRALRHYINDGLCDYENSRRIINGLDHALEIAAVADQFKIILEACETPDPVITS